MAVTVQRQFESAVTERDHKALVGSSMANGATLIQFALRPLDLQRALGPPAPICGRQDVDPRDMPALSTCHKPLQYRLSVAPGSYRHAQQPRVSFPPDIPGGSPSQPMSQRSIRLCGSLAGVCGVSLRPLALIFAALFLMPLTTASSKRWSDAMGSPLPPPEAMLRPRLARAPGTEGLLTAPLHWGRPMG
jgi:hypothetical protein